MSEVTTAALMLLAAAIGVFALIFFVWRRQRGPAAPKPPKAIGEGKLPKFSRKSKQDEPEIEMAPERLARIGRKPVGDRFAEPALPLEEIPAAEAAPPMEQVPAIDAAPAAPIAEVEQTTDAVVDGDDDISDSAHAAAYDIADPAFLPTDWNMMLAMVDMLEARLDRLTSDDNPANHDARARAEEIIGIVRDSATHDAFSPVDAAAVMAALQAIPRICAISGEEGTETLTLPLTYHHPDAPLWVHDYHRLWAERSERADDTAFE